MNDCFEIFPERSLVRIVYRRHPTVREWQAMMEAILSDPRFRPGFHFLFDKRKLHEAASIAYVEEVSRFYRAHRHKFGRCAIVAGDLLAFGMSRMTEGYCIDGNVRAFMEVNEAEAWLVLGESVDPRLAA